VRTCSLSTLPIAARGRVSPVAAVAAVPTLPVGWILIARRNQRVAPLRRPSRMQSDPALTLQRSAAQHGRSFATVCVASGAVFATNGKQVQT